MKLARPMTAALLLATTLGCKFQAKAGYFEDDKKAALAAIDVFHQRLSAGEFEAIYENAGDALRARPKAELLAAMKETQQRWGKFIKAEVKSSSCFPSEVRFIVEAQFEKGEAGEMIIWYVPDKEAHLQHFQIFPGPVEVPVGSSNECRSGS